MRRFTVRVCHYSAHFIPSRIFHWRPGLVWQRNDMRRIVTDPHGKPAHGTLKSIAALIAFFLDYWLGFLLVIRPMLAKSTVVLFDRYFHDLFVEPLRYRYGGPSWLARLLSH